MVDISENPILKFRVRAEQDLQIPGFPSFNFFTYSNVVTIDIPAKVYVASAFTPNSDYRNDLFKIKTKFVSSGSITIYDRSGNVVFKGDIKGEGWDGISVTGKVAPAGSYSYVINGESLAGKEFKQIGQFYILN
jgi:gliding motility-associated-like protein